MRGEFVDVEGARLYYYAAGTRGAGEPIVLIHGFPTSGHVWFDLVPLLPPGHRVVVVDLLGFGRSDRPLGRDVSITGHARRVIGLLDDLRVDRACVVGHGFGGAIAQRVAIDAPERITRLALIASLGFDRWSTRWLSTARAVSPLLALLPAPVTLAPLRRELVRGYAERERGLRSVDLFLKPFSDADGRNAIVRHLRALDVRETARLGESLSSIRCPAAIVAGAEDPFVPLEVSERLKSAIAGSTLTVLPGQRHFLPEEAPIALAEAIAGLVSS